MCRNYECDEEYGELRCYACGSDDLELIDEYEEAGILYSEYVCRVCDTPYIEETEIH
jgi:hypothetical protein